MKVRLNVSTTRELKKLSYEFLWKLHDLERPKKTEDLLAVQLAGQAAILLMVRHLTSLLESLLKPVALESEGIHSSVHQLLLRLPRLATDLERSIDLRNPLRTRTLAWVLTSHTEAFNRLLEEAVSVEIDEEATDDWVGAVQCAVSIWKDNFELR